MLPCGNTSRTGAAVLHLVNTKNPPHRGSPRKHLRQIALHIARRKGKFSEGRVSRSLGFSGSGHGGC